MQAKVLFNCVDCGSAKQLTFYTGKTTTPMGEKFSQFQVPYDIALEILNRHGKFTCPHCNCVNIIRATSETHMTLLTYESNDPNDKHSPLLEIEDGPKSDD